jgi:hypothetical protein
MMLAIKLIHQTLDFASIYQGRFNDQRTMSLLSRHFRSDLHSARATNWIDASRLELTTLAGTRIVYRIENAKIIREVWETGKESNDAQQPNASDSYRLRDNQSAALSVQNDLATLIVETSDGMHPDAKTLPHKRVMIRAGYVSASELKPNDNASENANDKATEGANDGQ